MAKSSRVEATLSEISQAILNDHRPTTKGCTCGWWRGQDGITGLTEHRVEVAVRNGRLVSFLSLLEILNSLVLEATAEPERPAPEPIEWNLGARIELIDDTGDSSIVLTHIGDKVWINESGDVHANSDFAGANFKVLNIGTHVDVLDPSRY